MSLVRWRSRDHDRRVRYAEGILHNCRCNTGGYKAEAEAVSAWNKRCETNKGEKIKNETNLIQH